jgi:class 3 adenylate cyclase/tetratricopeptide (TPR) repeat protein
MPQDAGPAARGFASNFLPPWVRRALSGGGAPPWSHVTSGAVVWTDLVGFTPLVESFLSQGPAGAENLSVLLNKYFGWLIDVVDGHGGEVGAFVGDAALAIFSSEHFEGPADAARAAIGCALALQREVGAHTGAGDGRSLSHRVCVAYGPLRLSLVGDDAQSLHVMTGEAMDAIRALHAAAAPGQVLGSAQIVSMLGLGDGIQARLVSPGIFAVSDATAPSRPPAAPPAGDIPRTRGLLPAAVVDRVAAGHAAWLAELRVVTALFVSLAWDDPGGVGPLEATMGVLFAEVARLDGCPYQLVLDDKGLTFVALWGIPSQSHEDDAARAVRAGLAILAACGSTGAVRGAGVASGRTFTGVYGNDRRRHFAVLGSVMNLAARWMARARAEVLADAETQRAAGTRVAFDSLGIVDIKGRAEPVEVFRALAGRAQATSSPRVSMRGLGRATERAAVIELLDGAAAGRGALLRMTAEAGMGKTTLVQETLRLARQRGLRTLAAAGDGMEQTSALLPWRSAVSQALEGEAYDLESTRQRLYGALSASPDLLAYLPLMETLIPLGLQEDDTTRALAPAGRLERLQDLVVAMFRATAAERPTLLVFDDVHWFDTGSCALLSAVIERVPGLLVLLSSRPLAREDLPERQRLFAPRDGARDLSLSTLDEDALAEVVARRLGVSSAPAAVLALVAERAEGHPMFAEEITQALLDRGAVTVRDGVAQTAGLTGEVIAALPDNLHRMLMSRIDGLPPTEQLAVKVASVVGRSFTLDVLRAVFPVQTDTGRLEGALAALQSRRLIDDTEEDAPGSYRFRHALMERAAYETLLDTQRRQLHRAVAETLEEDEAPPSARLLAHHWSRVEGAEAKAVPYLAEAAKDALEHFAYREAVKLLGDLDQKARSLAAPVASDVRARWEALRCDAYVKLGDRDRSLAALVQSLSLDGVEVPARPAATAGEIAREVGRQVVRRARARSVVEGDPRERERFASLARRLYRVTELAWFRQDLGLMTWSTWCGLNVGERAGDSEGHAQLCGAACLSVGFLGMHSAADGYYARGMEMVERMGNPTTRADVEMACGIWDNAMGRWERAGALWSSASAHFERIGDRYRAIEGRAAVMFQEQQLGHWEQAAKLGADVDALARFEGGVLGRVQGRSGIAGAMLGLGGLTRDHVKAIESALADDPPPTERLIGHGTLASTWLALGEPDRAAASAIEAVEVGRKHPPLVYFVAPSVLLLVEACCALGRVRPASERAEWSTRARAAAGMLGGLRRTVASLRSTYHLAELTCAELDESALSTRWHRHEALRAAEAFGNPHDLKKSVSRTAA